MYLAHSMFSCYGKWDLESENQCEYLNFETLHIKKLISQSHGLPVKMSIVTLNL